MGENVYKQVYTSDSFSFTYQKDNFIKDDLNPTMYYDCVDNKTGIVYDKVREDVEYNITTHRKSRLIPKPMRHSILTLAEILTTL